AELPPGVRALPGHGPERPDVRAAAVAYLQHREQRLDQVRAAARQLDGEITARRIVEVVYADVDRSVWPAAEWSVRAQLTYLRETGELGGRPARGRPRRLRRPPARPAVRAAGSCAACSGAATARR